MKTPNVKGDPASGAKGRARGAAMAGASLGKWTAFWRGFKTFVLGRDRIDCQFAGWRQAYARYFGVRPLHKARP